MNQGESCPTVLKIAKVGAVETSEAWVEFHSQIFWLLSEILARSDLYISVKVFHVANDDADARCLMSSRCRVCWGRTEFGTAAKLWNFQILDNLGFRQKGDRFVEVCPAGWVGPGLPRALLIRAGLSESDTAIMPGLRHLPMYPTMLNADRVAIWSRVVCTNNPDTLLIQLWWS